MGVRVPIENEEYYHVYNRGAHKLPIFTSDEDRNRFMLLLFLANDDTGLNFRELLKKYKGRTFVEIYNEEKPSQSLVDVYAYCLMPNHFHLVLQQKAENGISDYMRKLSTAYTMYFNKKYDHSGVLFQGRFKAQHIDSDPYFRHIFSYVHLNPVDLYQSEWKVDGLKDKGAAMAFLEQYPYSSYYDYFVGERPESKIVTIDGEETPWFDDIKRPEQMFEFYEFGEV